MSDLIPRNPLGRLPWHLESTSTLPTGWTLSTLVTLWPFPQCRPRAKMYKLRSPSMHFSQRGKEPAAVHDTADAKRLFSHCLTSPLLANKLKYNLKTDANIMLCLSTSAAQSHSVPSGFRNSRQKNGFYFRVNFVISDLKGSCTCNCKTLKYELTRSAWRQQVTLTDRCGETGSLSEQEIWCRLKLRRCQRHEGTRV